MSEIPILQLTNISKSFPGVKALDSVSFEVMPGEVHALLGENGAGKSTLIKIVSGVYRPNTGEITIDGELVQFSTTRDAQEKGIATIYQEFSLYPELSVAENIFIGHAPQRELGPFKMIDWRKMRQSARELLASLDIHDMNVSQNVGTLSVGNKQRVEIAKALSLNARLLIMDEPTAALTEPDVAKLFEIVELLRKHGVAIIYISHRLSEVFEICDRVSVLRDGEYIGTQYVKDTNEDELVSMMVKRAVDNRFPKFSSDPGKNVLEVRGLSHEPLTKDVSFTLRAGEIVGFAGLVGSGRSELAHLLFGLRKPRSGSILIDGRSIKFRHPGQAIREGIAYVPEDRGTQGLVKEMTIKENVSLSILRTITRFQFIQFSEEKKLARNALQQLGIRAYSVQQIVEQLSGGNQQKVVVSRWLASDPKILIVDEPTRGVDVGAKAEIHRLLSKLAVERGLAIMMISSELPEIIGMSDRVYVMRGGQVVDELEGDEIAQERIAASMMGDRMNSALVG